MEILLYAHEIPEDLAEFFEPVNPTAKTDVFRVSTKPYSEAHFATFPEDLIEPCILAGCPARVCAECGAPHVRVTERKPSTETRKNWAGHKASKNGASRIGGFYDAECVTVGFEPSCKCDADARRGTVLDPFNGAGTTLMVAHRLGRRGVGIDINAEYCRMAIKRVESVRLPLLDVAESEPSRIPPSCGTADTCQSGLFGD